MDVTPPGAAGTASRPSRNTPSGIPLVLRRLAIGLAGAAIAVLAGIACALSFDDLRALAVSGRAEPQLAYLYPAAFDVLLVVALVSVPLLRGARLLVRFQAGFVLILLLASAAAANAATAVGVSFDPDASALVVALAPWVMLAVGLWLLLLLLKHVRTNRADLDDDDLDDESADSDDSDDDLVPFGGAREPRAAVTAPYPVAARERPAPTPTVTAPTVTARPGSENPHTAHAGPAHAATEEHGAPPLQPVPEAVAPPGYVPPLPVSPVSETVAPPEYAPPLPVTPPQDKDPQADDPQADDENGIRIADSVPEPARETGSEAASETASETIAEQAQDEPEVLPIVPPTAAPRTPPVTEQAEPAITEPAVAEPVVSEPAVAEPVVTEPVVSEPAVAEPVVTEPVVSEPAVAEPVVTEPAVTEPAETGGRPAQPRRNRPVRWGDLVRPHTGDVLVHPRPKPDEPADAEQERAEDEAGVDTQPLRQIRDVPDPAHGSDCADPGEQDGGREPYAAEDSRQEAPDAPDAEDTTEDVAKDDEEGTVPMAPPSGRMRSTPRPPD
ncbi:DUF2637 domain-containing protein [Microbispora hainanensis]|uniref:DUF2637 domain-containing protein n=1 Tax=Microbispora hainanensis TaxID=568844 RepID=A0A544YGW8_9ACTN|nr:DUF2637 domain-containing protein [Microbispora hainanensis]TQS16013.1 DUF2637 domain-containing protein [Microbispora hainanensis]